MLCSDGGTRNFTKTSKANKDEYALPRKDRARVRIIHAILIPHLGRPAVRRRCFQFVEMDDLRHSGVHMSGVFLGCGRGAFMCMCEGTEVRLFPDSLSVEDVSKSHGSHHKGTDV
jgi:hypothetical protein